MLATRDNMCVYISGTRITADDIHKLEMPSSERPTWPNSRYSWTLKRCLFQKFQVHI